MYDPHNKSILHQAWLPGHVVHKAPKVIPMTSNELYDPLFSPPVLARPVAPRNSNGFGNGWWKLKTASDQKV